MLSADLPLVVAAGKALPPLIDGVFACEAATRAGDPEAGVHEMRVATKRLREAWRAWAPAFRGRRRAHGTLGGRIEALNDALGAARDPDVMANRLGRLAEEGAPLGAERVAEALKAERQRAFGELIVALDGFGDLRAALSALVAKVASSPREAPLGPVAFAAIRANAARVLARWQAVRRRASPDALHEARKANKRLRYSLELFVSFLPDDAASALVATVAFHDALGTVHDADELRVVLDTAVVGLPAAERATWGPLLRRLDQRRHRGLVDASNAADGLADVVWPALVDLGR